MGKINGYIRIWCPEKPLSAKDGYAYEHRLVAEQKLGRALLDDEIVHHIDGDRSNNSENNIMVFATQADHNAFHATGVAILLPNGSYRCVNKKELLLSGALCTTKDHANNCFTCGKLCIEKYCSHECASMGRRKAKRPTADELSYLVDNNSFEKVGRMFGVTGAAVKKWLKQYNIQYKPYHKK